MGDRLGVAGLGVQPAGQPAAALGDFLRRRRHPVQQQLRAAEGLQQPQLLRHGHAAGLGLGHPGQGLVHVPFDVQLPGHVGPGQPEFSRRLGQVGHGRRRADSDLHRRSGRAGMAAVIGRELHRGSGPATASKTSASAIAPHSFLSCDTSASRDALLVQAEQAALAVVGALERAVRLAVVAPVEVVLGVERRGIQRLVPVEPAPPRPRRGGCGSRRPGPRAAARSPRTRSSRTPRRAVVGKGPDALAAQSQRAHPYRTHSHIFLEKSQELGTTFDRDLHVLDDRLPWREVPLACSRSARPWRRSRATSLRYTSERR